MLRDPVFYVVLVAALLVVMFVRSEACRLDDLNCTRALGIHEIFTSNAQAIAQMCARIEESVNRPPPRARLAGMVLVLGSIQLADGTAQQFCAGRLFRLNEDERGEFAETMYMPLVPGTLVIALGNLVLDGVLANQRSFVPWSEQHGGAPVAVVPETIQVGGQLRVGVRGHAW